MMKHEDILLDTIINTNKAILYELFTYPSFGLVSPYSAGSHTDMDHYTFLESASVLNKYMYLFAKCGYREQPIETMYEEAVQIGIKCEQAMFKETNGVNTHKGLIFVLGTLVVSTLKALYDHDDFDKIFRNCQRLVSNKRNELKNMTDKVGLSHGESIYLKYQIEGVRKEASLGFPIIKKALTVLDLNDKSSFVKTLVYIMSLCDDTTIIHRYGLEGLQEVKETMNNLITEGFDNEVLLDVNEQYIEKGISPGGSADLLSGALFLLLMKDKFI